MSKAMKKHGFGAIFCLLLLIFAASSSYFVIRSTPVVHASSDGYVKRAKILPVDQNVWLIGDSYIDNDFMRNEIRKTLGDIRIEAQWAKRFAYDLEDNISGLNLMRQLLSENDAPEYLIYELSTNDYDVDQETAAGWISELRNMVDPDTSIILMTANSIWRDDCERINLAIREAAARDPRIYIADWERASDKDKRKYLGKDDLHPSKAGHRLITNLFKEQLEQAYQDKLSNL